MTSDSPGPLPPWNRWIPVPLRLFMGVTFLYAGMQKLADPQYFNPAARGSIGHQIAAFATASPLRGFLLGVALPHATLFGALVAYGELAIGLGMLLGLLWRVAALFGLLLNLLFLLSADWHIFPYFYGSDIVFLFCWLTLLIAGPAQQALPALDIWLARWLAQHTRLTQRPRLVAVCQVLCGTPIRAASRQAGQQTTATAISRALPPDQARRASRRSFLGGIVSGGTLMLALLWLAEALHLLPVPGLDRSQSGTALTPTPGSPVAGGTPTAVLAGSVIARIRDVPPNSAATFTIPSTSAPGILVHLAPGLFVAFNAVCTHAGCPVDYDPALRDLVCPCHGAAFDPSQGAAVINGPAQFPLTGVPIIVDLNAGTVSLAR
jgi:thiosulfate dehydrogenase [quinone] large subunit